MDPKRKSLLARLRGYIATVAKRLVPQDDDVCDPDTRSEPRETRMRPELEARVRGYMIASAALHLEAMVAQQNCAHEHAWELPGCKDDSFLGKWHTPRRLCCQCRYEEEGAFWCNGEHWERNDGHPAVLAKSRIVAQLPKKEFVNHRLPVRVVADVHVHDPDDPMVFAAQAYERRQRLERRQAEAQIQH